MSDAVSRPAIPCPRRTQYPGLRGTLGAGLLVLLGAGCCTPNPVPAPPPFRVMTWNIHHGKGTDGRVDLERIAAVIRVAQADVVALQEVDKGVRRTGRRDMPAELAALTGLTCLFSNNFHFQGGEYGNALLTRFPVRHWTNTHLRMLRTGEQRGVLQAILEVQGRELLVLNTHIDYRRDDTERLANVAQFCELLSPYAGMPALFAGDFNDLPESRTWRAMAAWGEDLWLLAGTGPGYTYPSTGAVRRIDYLWRGRGTPLKPLGAWVLPSDASDHLPVVVELIWDAP